MRILASSLLIAVLLACALSHASSANQRSKKRPTAAAGGQSSSSWKLGTPVSFQNLTVFPVISNTRASADEFITLDEGLRSGKVVIAELGANGRARRLRPDEQIGDEAEVNKLAVINTSGKKLILIAGELLVGGKQDRIVSHDCIVASTGRPVPIDVFCVEHGRWHEEASFGQSRDVGNQSQQNVGSGSGRGVGGGVGGGSGSGVGAGSGSGMGSGSGGTSGGDAAAGNLARLSPGLISFGGVASSKNPSSKEVLIVSPNVRATAQAEKSQNEVWSEVDKTVSANNVSTSTDRFTSVYKDESVSKKLEDYEQAFGGKFSGENIVGAVIAVDGTIISADVFASHSLFKKYWPKLLKSSALQALNSPASDAGSIDVKAAEAFLSRAGGSASSESRKGVYRITEHQSDEDASFELQSATKGESKLVHFNRMKKQ